MRFTWYVAAVCVVFMIFVACGTKQGEGEMETSGEKTAPREPVEMEVFTTESGLQYSILKEGTGPKPDATDRVTVHYRGPLTNGTEFDSSYKRGQPASFSLQGVIRGWTEGLQLMNVGSKFRFIIPPF